MPHAACSDTTISRLFLHLQSRFTVVSVRNHPLPRDSPGWHRGENVERDMRLILALILLTGVTVTSGCVPVAIGAGGAIAADTIAEDRGGDLF